MWLEKSLNNSVPISHVETLLLFYLFNLFNIRTVGISCFSVSDISERGVEREMLNPKLTTS